MRLQYIFFYLQKQWEIQQEKLIQELQHQGIISIRIDDSMWNRQTACLNQNAFKTDVSDSVLPDLRECILITDDRCAAQSCKEKLVCVGCEIDGTAFFDGAELVTDDLTALDAQQLEELLLHTHGYPVTIAHTQRLLIREIEESDFEGLRKISRQEHMQYAFGGDSKDGGLFETERLRAYCASVYRFYGYGLWSVLKKDGTLIGCCGLSEYEYADTEVRLEMQYMLEKDAQKFGYAQEMCRAVLQYAAERTDWTRIWIRTRKENEASCRLAERLGFCLYGEEKSQILLYMREI